MASTGALWIKTILRKEWRKGSRKDGGRGKEILILIPFVKNKSLPCPKQYMIQKLELWCEICLPNEEKWKQKQWCKT